MAGFGVAVFAMNAAYGLFVQFPRPAVHDEFGYLLTADTFCRGRLSNPTHTCHEHFQTYYVLQQPTYQAKYPPAQSVSLAVGAVLLGEPIFGVWFMSGFSAACLGWMLAAFVRPQHWVVVSLVYAFNAVAMLQWSQSFWGGGVAFTAGCLLCGGLKRALVAKIENRRGAVVSAVAIGLGLVVLSASRPYEGFLTSIPAGLVFLWHWLKADCYRNRTYFLFVVTPILLVLLLGAFATGAYNHATTGSSLRMPYMEWLRQEQGRTKITSKNALLGTFLGSRTKIEPLHAILPMNPDDPSVEEDARESMKLKVRYRRTRDFLQQKLINQWLFYLGPLASLPLLAIPWCLGNRWLWYSVLVCFLASGSTVASTMGGYPHYVAPAAPMLYLILAFCIQTISHQSNQRALRENAARSPRRQKALIIAFAAAIPFLFSIQLALDRPDDPTARFRRWGRMKEHAERQMTQHGQRHLVFVRYGSGHPIDMEWVYNSADIDSQSVVWARDLGIVKNRELFEYYAGMRQAWVIRATRFRYTLQTYDSFLQGESDAISFNFDE